MFGSDIPSWGLTRSYVRQGFPMKSMTSLDVMILGCKVHRILSYVSLGTYVKNRIRTCRILASQVRRYVRRIKLKGSLFTNFFKGPKTILSGNSFLDIYCDLIPRLWC